MPLIGVSLNAVSSAPSTGAVVVFDVPHANISMQVHTTGTGVSSTVVLQGSVDGVNFANLTSLGDDGIASVAGTAIIAARALVTALSGTSPALTATIAAA